MRRRRLLVLVVMFSSHERPNETLRDFSTQLRLYILQLGQDVVTVVHCRLPRRWHAFHCVIWSGHGRKLESRERGDTPDDALRRRARATSRKRSSLKVARSCNRARALHNFIEPAPGMKCWVKKPADLPFKPPTSSDTLLTSTRSP